MTPDVIRRRDERVREAEKQGEPTGGTGREVVRWGGRVPAYRQLTGPEKVIRTAPKHPAGAAGSDTTLRCPLAPYQGPKADFRLGNKSLAAKTPAPPSSDHHVTMFLCGSSSTSLRPCTSPFRIRTSFSSSFFTLSILVRVLLRLCPQRQEVGLQYLHKTAGLLVHLLCLLACPLSLFVHLLTHLSQHGSEQVQLTV